MSKQEALSDIRGVLVIAVEEASNLGTVDRILVDPESKKLSALAFKNKHTGKEMYVDSEDVSQIGDELVLIPSEARTKPYVEGQEPPGRRLRKLRGMRVTTQGGKRLGNLEDFDITPDDWAVSELHLDGDRRLPVKAADLVIGPDEILVPASYADRVVEAPHRKGFFERVRGWTHRSGDSETSSRPGA